MAHRLIAVTSATLILALTTGLQAANDSLTTPALSTQPFIDLVDHTEIAVEPATFDQPSTLSLNDCVDLALVRNYGLINSRRDLASAESEYRESWGEYIPALTLGSSYGRSESKSRAGTGYERTSGADMSAAASINQRLPTGGSISAGYGEGRNRTNVASPGADDSVSKVYDESMSLSLTQPLLRGGGLDVGLAGLRQSRISLIEGQISDHLSQRNTVLEVIGDYYNILSAQLDIKVSHDALSEKEQFLNDTKVRHELGLIAPSEILIAEIQYLKERNNMVSLESKLGRLVDVMLVRLGLPLDAPIAIAPSSVFIDRTMARAPSAETCVAEALAFRPEVAQAILNVRASEITLVVRQNNLLPSLDLSLDFTENSDGPEHGADDYTVKNQSRSMGLSFSVPYPNITPREERLRAELNLETARTNRDKTMHEIARDARDSYRQIQTKEANIDILKRLVEQAQISLEFEKERFNFGLNTPNDVRDAQDNMFQAQNDYYQTLLEYQVDIARLFKTMGRPLF